MALHDQHGDFFRQTVGYVELILGGRLASDLDAELLQTVTSTADSTRECLRVHAYEMTRTWGVTYIHLIARGYTLAAV